MWEPIDELRGRISELEGRLSDLESALRQVDEIERRLGEVSHQLHVNESDAHGVHVELSQLDTTVAEIVRVLSQFVTEVMVRQDFTPSTALAEKLKSLSDEYGA